MKAKAIKVLALATVATACLGVATITAQETSATGAAATFQMVDGAGVRMGATADESAIRFIANVPDLTDKDYRMLIVPTKVLTANNIEADDNVVATLKANYTTNYDAYFLDMEVTPFEHEDYGNCVMAAMMNVNANRYAEEYTGIAYYMDGETYVYASFSDGNDIYENARSVSYVASAALNSGKYAEHTTVLEGFVKGSLDGETYALDQSDEVAKIGDIITLTDNVAETTNLDVNYVSNNTDVVTVENGKVTVVGKGSATVTAKIGTSFEDSVKFTTFTTGDEETMRLATNYTAATGNVSRFYNTSLTTDVKAFADEQEKPFDDATSYVEYTLKTNADRGDDTYYANFLNFSAYTETVNTRSTAPIPAYLYEKSKDIDWANAFMSFYFYNDSGFTATLYGTLDTTGLDLSKTDQEQQGEVITTVAPSSWTKVTVSLKDYCGIQSDVIATGDYNIKVWISVQDTSVTADNLADKSWSFYMTGVEFFTPTVEDMMVGNYSPDTFAISIYERGALSAQVKDFGAVSAPEATSYSSYIDYTMSGGNQGAKGNKTFASNFINFSAYTGTANTQVTNPISAELYNKYKNIDWSNAYMSFYFYNATGKDVTLYGTDNDFGGGAPSKTTESYGTAAIQTISAGTGWTKVTVSLADYCGITSDVIATGNYNIKLWLTLVDTSVEGLTYAEIEAKTWSFYVTGFEFRNLTADEQSVAINEQIKNNYVNDTVKFNKWLAGMTMTSSVNDFDNVVSAPPETSYSTYINYTLQATSQNTSKNVAYAGFINFSASSTGYAISSNQNAMPNAVKNNYGEDFDWANASVSFWIYNASSAAATLYGTHYFDNSTTAAANNTDNVGAALQTEIKTQDWTKVTLKLSDFTTQYDVASGNYKIQLWLGYDCTDVTTDNYANYSWSFYMTGFEFVA